MLNYSYCVAGHKFKLQLKKDSSNIDLSNLAPFLIEEDNEDYLFQLTINDAISNGSTLKFISSFDNDVASIDVSRDDKDAYLFKIQHPDKQSYCLLSITHNFSKAEAKLPDCLQHYYLNNCLMLLYAFSTAPLNTLLIHASAIKKGKYGYLFLGKSGTGKSTHSQLWLKHIESCELLNDDNPIIRFINGSICIYGSPWSGKTDCYKNNQALLNGIVKLEQAPENVIKKLSDIQSYAQILPACSCLRCDKQLMEKVHETVEKVATTLNSFHLKCLPNKDAALLSYNTLSK